MIRGETDGELINRKETTDAIDERFTRYLTERGYKSFEEADDGTKLFLDGIMEALDVVLGMPAREAQWTAVWPGRLEGSPRTYLCDPRKNVRCPKGITCFLNGGPCQETTREEFRTDPATQAELMGYTVGKK